MLSLEDYEKSIKKKPLPCSNPKHIPSAVVGSAATSLQAMALRDGLDANSASLQYWCANTVQASAEERANLWVINLGDTPGPSCMAVRVGPRTLMTAGHCIKDKGTYKSNLPGSPAFQCKRLGHAWVDKTQRPPSSVVDAAICTLEVEPPIALNEKYETVSFVSQTPIDVVGVSTTLTCGHDTLDWRKFLVRATLASPLWTMDFAKIGTSIPLCPTDSGSPVYTATKNVADRRLVGTVSGHWGLDVLASASVALEVHKAVLADGAICHDGLNPKPTHCR